MAVRLLRTKGGVNVSIVLIDHNVALAPGQHLTRGRKGRHYLRESLPSIARFGDENDVASGRLPVAHVNCLRSVGRYPLAIIGGYSSRHRINLPLLARLDATSSSIVGGGHCYISQPKAGYVEITPGA